MTAVVRVRLDVRPVTLTEARRFVGELHRHNLPPVGWLFGCGIEDDTGQLRGVVTAGRPVARAFDDDGRTVEVTRTCTDGVENGNSMLYGAIWRAAKALGYRRGYTYTLASEPGTSLLAAGWELDAELPARGGWDNGRARYETDLFGNQRTPTEAKYRWVKRVKPREDPE
jgi:hypothetical protein